MCNVFVIPPFCIGDFVYFVDKFGDSIPCVVKAIKKDKLLVRARFFDSTYARWVKSTNCHFQEGDLCE